MIQLIDAVLSLAPNAEVAIRNNEIEWIKPSKAPVSRKKIDEELVRLQAEYDANEYQRQRAKEYPSFADQFDLLYHGGYDAWKDAIQAVKDKYPKD